MLFQSDTFPKEFIPSYTSIFITYSFVHNKNFDELYKHIPQEILPAEYGGTAGPIKDICGEF
jgi:hypothetical protein